MEPAHVLIVQASSVLALLSCLVALFFIGRSLPKFSPSMIKTAVTCSFVFVILFFIATIFMAVYHIFDIDLATDIWHIGVMLGLIVEMAMAVYVLIISRKFNVKF